MDIKIGAVFSLANNSKASKSAEMPGNETATIENNDGHDTDVADDTSIHLFEDSTLIESNETDALGAKPISKDLQDASTVQNKLDESTDSADTDQMDQDSPPRLSMEKPPAHTPAGEFYLRGENVMPPVLHMENIKSEEHSSNGKPKIPTMKRECTKIYPSYLVLTNVQPVLGTDKKISFRKYKRLFRECPNMCKKVHFRRRLNAGKDVFNVKAPSKQKEYHLYLRREEERVKSCSRKDKGSLRNKKTKWSIDVASLIAYHDKQNAKKVGKSGEKTAARIRRVILHVPKDFQMNSKAKLDTPEESRAKEREEKRVLEVKKQLETCHKQRHEKELAILKKQIKMKRNMNKHGKRMRRLEKETSRLVSPDSGTSFSGRKRKMNSKYGAEFALTKDEVNRYMALARIENQMQKELKKLKEEVDSHNRGVDEDISLQKGGDVVIDNPESSKVKPLKTEKDEKGLQESQKDRRNRLRRMRFKLKKELKGEVKHSMGNKKSRLPTAKEKSADGVIIRDMPNENLVIKGILNNAPIDSASSPSLLHGLDTNKAKGTETKIDAADPYSYAKALLKSSLLLSSTRDTKANGKGAKPTNCNQLFVKPRVFETTPEMETEKAKKLKIPENVQKLFKVKTEPIDPEETALYTSTGSVSSSYICTTDSDKNHKVAVKTIYPDVLKIPRKEPVTYTLTSTGLFQPNSFPNTSSVANNQSSTIIKQSVSLMNMQSSPFQVLNSKTNPPTSNQAAVPLKFKASPYTEKYFSLLTSTQTTLAMPSNSVVSQSGNKIPLVKLSSQGVLAPSTEASKFGIPTRTTVQMPNQTSVSSASIRYGNSVLAFPTVSGQGLREITPVKTINPHSASAISNAIKPLKLLDAKPLKIAPSVSLPSQTIASSLQNIQLPVVTSQAQPLTSTTSTLPEKCKFYLIRVDDKNILIPIQGSQTQPRAYVVNDEHNMVPNTPIVQIPSNTLKNISKPSAAFTHNLTSPPNAGGKTGKLILQKQAHINPTAVPIAKIVPTTKATTTQKPTILFNEGMNKSNSTVFSHQTQTSKTDTMQMVTLSKSVGKSDGNENADAFPESNLEAVDNMTKPPENDLNKFFPITVKQEKPDPDEVLTVSEKHKTNSPEAHNRPFSEGVSDRDEKLRKLKELLKQKQKAVEEIRANRLKSS